MPAHDNPQKPEPAAPRVRYLRRYIWIIIKNVVGWVLMLSALAVGSVFPVPLGTPMFLIGFALITLPGKRHITSGALRGIPIKLYTRSARRWRLAISLLLPPLAVWFLAFQRHPIIHPSRMPLLHLCVLYGVSIVAAWIFVRVVLMGINLVLRILPRTRRHVRPWLRGHGINLLPPRRKSRNLPRSQLPDEQQILEFGRDTSFRRRREKD